MLLAEQLPQTPGAPVRLKVLGEELIAWRDGEGALALTEARCPHRGANLFFGRAENGGLRCVYHGWKFDHLGQCVEMPTIPPEIVPRMCEKARIRAYPVVEWGGLLWAYLGTESLPPELPQMEFARVPPTHRHVSKKLQECNWAQAAEGGLDTAHFSFLHQPVIEQSEDAADKSARATRGYAKETMSQDHVRWMRDDPRPQYQVRRHGSGLVMGASRRAGAGENYWRIAQYLMPCHGYTPSATEGQTYHGQSWVPIDDRSCWIYVYSWNPTRPLTDAERASYLSGGAVYPEMDDQWRPVRNRGNDYLIDRGMQQRDNYSGIVGVSEQDAAIQDSQGEIADRTRELLGPTDLGVVQFRRLMLEAARSRQAGGTPLGLDDAYAYQVRAGAIVTADSLAFDEVMMRRFSDPLGRVLTCP